VEEILMPATLERVVLVEYVVKLWLNHALKGEVLSELS
jgi:hypothetical protein